MPDSTDCQTEVDPNFIETVGLLNSRGVPYWICHGTLLGLIRDGGLIPWDLDIDFGIWEGNFSKHEMIELMTANGYLLKSDGSDYDFVAFTKSGGREVDFNYYRVSDNADIAYSEWFIPRSRLTTLLDLLASKAEYSGKWRRLVRPLYCFSGLAKALTAFLKGRGLFYRSAGYTTPVGLLKEFDWLETQGTRARVPVSATAVLEFVYGKDWRVPKPKYDWTKESPSTRVSNSRFG